MRAPQSCSRFPAILGAVLAMLGAAREAHALSGGVIISQIYGGVGNSGAIYRNDLIELFNRGGTAVSLAGWSVQYASSTGSSWQVTPLSGVIQPGQYFLIQEAAGAGNGAVLPVADASGSIAMSASAGKVILASNTSPFAGTCPASAAILDLVGYGGANCFEGSPTGVLSNGTAALRQLGGCAETDSNELDFNVSGPPSPRNSSTPAQSCADQAPGVSATSPANGESNVPAGSSINVVFSEPVNVLAGAIDLECPLGNAIAQNAGALTNVTSAQLTPASGLPSGTACRINVSAAGVNDVDANDPPDHPDADFAALFTTVGAPACAAPDTPIGQIQGSGATAALTGVQTVQGIVIADYEYPGTGALGDSLRGFYVQNSPETADGDPATSDGLFVFNSSANSVSLGQIVQVTGNVTEFNFNSSGGTLTELTSPLIEVCAGTGSIAPVNVALPLSSAEDWERYEGMLVRFAQQLFVTEHFNLDRFGALELSAGARLPQPTNVAAPGAAAAAQQAANDASRIVLDDDGQNQDPDPIRFGPGLSPLSATNTLRAGDWVQGLTGVLTQSDATTASNVSADSDPVLYRVRPFNVLGGAAPDFQVGNPRPGAPAPATGRLIVAGFNLLNYFDTFGANACTLGVGGAATECRGADDATEFDRQSRKTVQAALGTGADILVMSELENDGYAPQSAIADLTGKLNAASAPGTWAFLEVDARTAQTNALGVDAIRVAMLYKPARVTPIGRTAVANSGAFGLYQLSSGAPLQRNRPALAQAFRETGPGGGQLVLVGNHLKSKGSGCADNVSPVGADPDALDGQGNCNLTRTAAAQELVSWLARDPTGTAEARVLILGDMNSYAKEDPIRTITEAGYTDVIQSHVGEGAYSYVFDGQWGYLDHALASASLVAQVASVVEWHINADEPRALDYNTDFKSAGQIASLYAPSAFRASDHDPVIVSLNLTASVAAPLPALGAVPLGLLGLSLGASGLLALRHARPGGRKRTLLASRSGRG